MKNIILLVSLLVLSFFCSSAWAVNGDMGGDDPNGSEANPYLIEDIDDFDVFASDSSYWASNVHTKLMTNIDLSGRTYTTAVIAPPITTISDVFDGIFNGNNHSVINLKINTDIGNAGLFGMIFYEAEVINLSVKNTCISGGNISRSGCLVASNRGIIKNCFAAGSLTGAGTSNSGGLCGNNHGIISGCYAISEIAVADDSERLGGLCGENWGGSINNCYAISTVKAGNNSNYLGGLCGKNRFGTISNCYSSGTVIGGSGSSFLGVICGYQIGNSSTIENCFWDIETSGMTPGHNLDPTHPGTIINVLEKTTVEMMTQGTFTGWDFSTPVWIMLRELEDYPRMAWQEVSAGDIAGQYGVDNVDFALLASQWNEPVCNGSNNWCQGADIDHLDGVDIKDLLQIANDWLSGY